MSVDSAPMRKIRVLVVDDSALMRRVLIEILSTDPDIEVVGSASDPHVARDRIKALDPDVLTLDIEMPRLDGLDFLERLMRLRPMPVVMVSSLTTVGADKTLRALELGAVDVVAKPTSNAAHGLAGLKDDIIEKVKAASRARVHPTRRQGAARLAATTLHLRPPVSKRVVALGASTGGVAALTSVLTSLPAHGPPILVTQHMPAGFTRTFAKRLHSLSAMNVHEAEDQMPVEPGHGYIAPGDKHLLLARNSDGLCCVLTDGEPINGHKPAVDALFNSVADIAGRYSVGVLLTGMGKDGANGLLRMRRAGAATACQDEASSLIYGMPKAAKSAGAAECELPLDAVVSYILEKTCGTPILAAGSELKI